MESTPPPESPKDWNYSAAFLLLRLFLALRALFAGLEKFEAGGRYSLENLTANAGRLAEGITGASFLPLALTGPFALVLGPALLVLGLALLVGIKTRVALTAMGLLYVALAVGLMAVQENEGVAWLGLHVLLTAVALVWVRHNRFEAWR